MLQSRNPSIETLQPIKTHVNRIFAKLALRDRVQAVVVACESGLVRPGDITRERPA
jgi:hypothetical protein